MPPRGPWPGQPPPGRWARHASAAASSITRAASTRTRWRRYSADPWTSPGGSVPAAASSGCRDRICTQAGADQRSLSTGGALRRTRDPAEHDPGIAAHPAFAGHRRRHGHDGEVAVPPRELADGRAGPGHGQPHLDDHLVWAQVGFQEAPEESRGGNHPVTAAATRHDLGVEQQRCHAPLGRRIGVGDAPAECPRRPDRVMADVPRRPREHPEPG